MKKGIMLAMLPLLMLSACQKESNDDPLMAFGTSPTLVKVTKEQALAQGEAMFDDNETVDEIISPNRYFNVNEPVKASMTSDGKLRLYNFMEHTFKDLSVWLVPNGLNDTIRLVKFDEVPPMYDIRIDSPLKMGEAVYEGKNGKAVRVKNLALLLPTEYSLVVTCTDEMLDKVRTIKMKTKIQMGRYGEGNWALMTPAGARYLTAAAINMAVMFSSQVFRDSVLAYPDLLPDNEGNPVDREKLLSQIIAKGRLVMGLVANYEGLGGGDAFGLRYGLLPNMFFQNRVVLNCSWPVNAFTHELGHCIGYAHGSAMCYGKISDVIAPNAYIYMIKHKMLPYTFDPYRPYNDYNPTAIGKKLLIL